MHARHDCRPKFAISYINQRNFKTFFPKIIIEPDILIHFTLKQENYKLVHMNITIYTVPINPPYANTFELPLISFLLASCKKVCSNRTFLDMHKNVFKRRFAASDDRARSYW